MTASLTLFKILCALKRFLSLFFFFFQAEDGIRDLIVTGVQTCAFPIYAVNSATATSAATMIGLKTLAGRFAASTAPPKLPASAMTAIGTAVRRSGRSRR